MKIITSVFILMLLGSCTTVTRVSEKTMMCKENALLGSCAEKMKKSCPNGHKEQSSDSSYGFGGMKNTIYFSCN